MLFVTGGESATMLLFICFAVGMVSAQTATEEFVHRPIPDDFHNWRVPFQTKAALKSLNNAHGDDFDLSQLVTSVNDTDSAQLLAMGLTVDQQAWAKRYHQLLQPMSDGAVLALKECRRRFEDQRWNCPIDKPAFFEKIFKTGSPEASFVYAVQAAGIALAVARTCSQGDTSGVCGCDQLWKNGGKSAVQTNSSWSWGPCSDNMHYAYKQTFRFLSAGASKSQKTEQDLMALHNYKLGLEVAKEKMQFLCKCHGLTGSCVHKTCWYSVSKIQIIGRALMRKHAKSVRVKADLTNSRLERQDKEGKRPQVKDAVHLHDSPSYCERNHSLGSLGTAGRKCGTRSNLKGNCDNLCCGRGHTTRRYLFQEKCDCHFEWCCRVRCNVCERAGEVYWCV